MASWSLWPDFVLRSAGFPFHELDAIRLGEAGELVQQSVETSEAIEAVQRDAPARFEAAVELLGNGIKGALQKRTRQGRPIEEALLADVRARDAGLADAGVRWNALLARGETLARALDEALRREQPGISQALRERARREDFQVALHLESPGALGAVNRLLAGDGKATHDARATERTIAKYWQRFAAKCDTVSYFGPIAWARMLDDQPASVRLSCGEPWIGRTEVVFEHWAVEALAQSVREDPAAFAACGVQRSPLVRVEGGKVFSATEQQVELEPIDAALVLALERPMPIAELAGRVDPAHAGEALEHVAALVEASVLVDALSVPVGGLDPLARLEEAVRTLGPAGAPHLEALAELGALAAAVASSSGKLKLDRIAALNARFEARTGAAARRRPGQTYSGRQIFFEDCHRNVALTLGGRLRDAMRTQLPLVGELYRWRLLTLAEHCRAAFRAGFDAHARDGRMPLAQFIAVALPDVHAEATATSPGSSIFQELARIDAEARERLGRALGLRPDQRRIEIPEAEFRARTEGLFPNSGASPYHDARWACPDVMLAARDEAAFDRGEFSLVLGELHVGANILCGPLFFRFAPDRERLAAGYARAAPEAIPYLSISPKYHHRGEIRPPDVPALFIVQTSKTRADYPGRREVPIAACSVFLRDDALRVSAGDHEFDLMEVLGPVFLSYVLPRTHFKLFPGPHAPRVTVGGLTLARERWDFDAAALAPLLGSAKRLHERPEEWLLALERLRRAHGMPERVFVSSDAEPKPFLLDFRSPHLCSAFASVAARSKRISLSEMLPGPEELWFHDARGAYVTELRMTLEALGG